MKKYWIWIGLVLLAGAAWKLLLLRLNVVPFNADEAVVGLMARHILQGERPIFFYGQSYMGSLDAIFTALGFSLFGPSIWVIRVTQGILYLCWLITTIWLGREAFQSVPIGILAAVTLVISSVNVTLYTTATLGGYIEALIIGNILMLQGIRFAVKPGVRVLILFGMVAGLGMWVNALTLVFSVPVFVFIAVQLWGKHQPREYIQWLTAIVMGVTLGAFPWLVYAMQQGPGNLIGEILGSAVSVEGGGWIALLGMHLVNLFLLAFPAALGFRPPWEVSWLALPLLPFALIGWGIVLVHFFRASQRDDPFRNVFRLFGGITLTLTAGFLFTSFGVDPSGRYFLPLAAPMSLALGAFVWKSNASKLLRIGTFVVIALFQFWGNVQCILANPPGFTTQFDASTIIDHRFDNELIAFLKEKGEFRGYSNYWVSYPLAFLSNEEILFVPRLPYHKDLRYTNRDNRYLPYSNVVESSSRVAYITTKNPALDGVLVDGFRSAGILWKEKNIGDYKIYYDLSSIIRPEELGLGKTSP